MILLQKMIVLFLMMMVGYVLYKKKILDEGNSKAISSIVINVANPALIISSAFSGADSIKGRELLITFLIAIIMFALLILVSLLIPRILRVEKGNYGIYKIMMIFSNIGFMGFPIISSLYGNTALLYASVFVLPYNILIYTYGIKVMRKETSNPEKNNLKQILNIGVIACFCAAFLYLSKIPLPDFAESTILYLSNLTAPLSMIVIGTTLAEINLLDIIKDVRLLFFMLIKLLLIPIAGCLILGLFIKNEVLLGVCIVMLATPVGSMTAMLAQQYGGDYETSSKYVVTSTLFSVVTIPIVFTFLT